MILILSIVLAMQLSACSSSLITQGPTNVTKTYSSSTAAREDVTLQCEFDGSQNISILWFFSSNQLSTTSDYMITNYANRSVLTIFNATISDIGSYICNASNDATSEAKSAYIHVTDLPTITQHPSSKNVTKGASVTFNCDATGFPTPAFTWTKNTTTVANTSTFLYLNNGKQLRISNVQPSNAGSYRCVVFQPASTTLSSNAAVLTVYYIEKPTLKPSSNSVTLKEGELLNISCSSNSLPAAEIKWVNNSMAIIASANLLTFNPVGRSNAGSYFCNATNVAGTLNSEVTVTVHYLDKPTFNTTSNNVALDEGEYLSITCNSVANPGAQYRWITSAGSLVSSTKTLEFQSLNRVNAKMYTCVANNSAGLEKSSNLTINVQYLDTPTFNTSSNLITVNESSYLSVICNATANPGAQYKWTTSSGTVVSSTKTLLLPSVNRNDAKTYTCVANNSAGLQKTATLTVNVQYLDTPTFNTSSSSITVNESSYLSVICNATANPGAQYKWTTSSGTVVSSTNTLLFQNINRNDAKAYTCVAKNSAGLQKTATLTVNVQYLDTPTFNTSSNSITVNESSYLSVLCNATANPGAQYKWTTLSGTVVSSTNTLLFQNINRNDAKAYTCVAKNSAGLQKTSTLTVVVQYIDTPTINTSSEITLNESAYLSIECNTSSHPVAQYKWIASSGETVSNTKILSFPKIYRNNASTYTCVASNGRGLEARKTLTIDVQYIDVPVFNALASVVLNETSSFVVSCNVTSNPSGQFKWTTYSGRIVSNSAVLTMNSVKRTDSGVYICHVSNAAGVKVSKNLTLDIQYIDTLSINLTSNSVILNETGRFAVKCNITAHPVAKYQWTKASGEVVSTSSVLSFNRVYRSDAMSYVCTASNNAGSETTNVEIKVHYLDKPYYNGTSLVDVTETTSLRVTCSAVSLPSATFLWSNYSASFSSSGADLIFNPISRRNHGIYYCTAKNSFGTKVSNDLTVNVQYIDTPTVNASADVRVIEGSPFNIICSSVANPNASYEWKNASGVVVSNSKVLSFVSIHRSDTDTYTCTAKNKVGSKSAKAVKVEVQSIDQPNFNASSQVTKNEGDSFIVQCFTNAYPVNNFKWETYDGRVVSNSSYLTFKSIHRGDTGVYRCIGSNPAGTRTSLNLTITVYYIDPPKFKPGGPITVTENDTISVSCSSVSFPNATYKWFDEYGREVSSSSLLNFSRINRKNASSYICNATNVVATRSSQSLRVNVRYLDAPVFSYKSYYSNGSKATVNCSADGYPGPIITWRRNGSEKVKGSMLMFNKILVSDAGNYDCVVENSLTTKRSSVYVNVTYKPVVSFTSSENLPNVPIGTTVLLTCDVNSVPIAQVTLKQDNVLLKSKEGSLSHTFTLQRSSSGMYTCTAKNFEGTSEVKKIVTVQERPENPQNFTVTGFDSRWIKVAWQPPTFDGNSHIMHYRLVVKNSSDFVHYNSTINISEGNVPGLAPFKTYHFVLTAVNAMGSSNEVKLEKKTDSEAPPVKKNALSKPTTSQDSVTVRLKKFDDIYGVISFYQVIVIKSQQSISSPDTYSGLQGFSNTTAGTPYITAEFAASYFGSDNEIDFAIGNKQVTSRSITTKRARRAATQGFYNQPLEAETNYQTFFRAFISDVKYSSTEWFTFKTSKKEGTGLSSGAIAGIVVGIALLIALVAVIAFFVKRRMEQEDKEDTTDSQGRKPRRPSLFKGSFHKHEIADPRDPVPIGVFEIHVNRLKANSNYGFSQEYAKFDKKYKHPYTHSSNPVNTEKNRYANIHPYDHSRVILQRDNNPGSDFINANYIRGFNGDTEYIAAQGPLPETISDFWRMIWEQSVTAIVMLTNCQENGRAKCAQYWPSQGSMTFKDLVVNAMEVLDFPDHVVRTFHLTKVGHAVERIVKHFHYISWPDHGVPSDPSALFSVIKKVNRWRANAAERAPLVVHCSAGVGRTGTYIVLDTQMNRVLNNHDVTIFPNVLSLRDSRYLMVQTEDQYAYLHYALLEFIKSGDTEVEAHELREYIKRKSDVDPDTGSTGMMDEFIALTRSDHQFTLHEANKACNHAKNRYKNVYPYDATRVRLSQIPGVPGSDYINASHIDGYVQVDAFIATQAPLSTTFPDFWRMVWETDSRSIVMVSREQEAGKVKVNCYWPTEGSIKIGMWIIELLNENSYTEYVLREFKVTNSEQGQSRVVRHYQYKAWPENGPPESAFGIIDLIGQVSKWNMTMENKTIIVHCSAGVGRTGVFIALTNLIERLKTEAVVDVYQTVKKLRQQRTAMVQTKDQYEFCYRALQEYLDSFDHYSNFE